MFTGIIEQKARVIANETLNAGNRLLIQSPFTGLKMGESIAVNGVCLTLLSSKEGYPAFDVSSETLRLTTLGSLVPGDAVNLERAMLATSRFGGHYVSGHVDTTAQLCDMTINGEFREILIGDFKSSDYRYLMPKGSITLDGVSLTINTVSKAGITVMLVPHTLAHTTFGQMKSEHRFNVEFDYVTRIVAHQLAIAGQLLDEVSL